MNDLKRIVIALGGNALQGADGPATAERQLVTIKDSAEFLADIIAQGHHVVIAHGNGPQVGRIVLQNEHAADVTPAMPFDVCGAMSQGAIGYQLQQGLSEVMKNHGIRKQAVTIVTQVEVAADDPAFQTPLKPIGPFYGEEEAAGISSIKGYTFREDAGRGFRRVVASPAPVSIIEIQPVKTLFDAGFIVITVGGGGIPVVRDPQGNLRGAAAVIDKDLAAEKLAEDIDADILLILTAVEQVSLDYGKHTQRHLDEITVAQATQYLDEGHFAPGSMAPKMRAAVQFAGSRAGRVAIITSLEKAAVALKGDAGTRITS